VTPHLEIGNERAEAGGCRHTGDFRADGEEHDTYQQAFKRVLRDLKQTPGCNPSAASHMAVSRRPAVVDER
jgi:hypothetical protein